MVFETQGRTRNRTRDLPKKGSAFILSSDHWTTLCKCMPLQALGAGGMESVQCAPAA